MTPKEYLSQVRRLDVLINQRIQQRDELRSYTGVSAVRYDGDKVQSSPAGEANYVKAVERAVELDEEITAKIDEFVDLKNKIISEIQTLSDPVHIQVLFQKYIQNIPLTKIAADMGYTYTYLAHVHGYALAAFGQQFPEIRNQ